MPGRTEMLTQTFPPDTFDVLYLLFSHSKLVPFYSQIQL